MKTDQKPVFNQSILDVRRVLQDQLDRLNKDDVNMVKEYSRSQAIQMIANPLIASAKIEADLMIRNPKFSGTGFVNGSGTKQLEQPK